MLAKFINLKISRDKHYSWKKITVNVQLAWNIQHGSSLAIVTASSPVGNVLSHTKVLSLTSIYVLQIVVQAALTEN